jgi:hypothetical protein
MGTRYYPVKIFGLYLGEVDTADFLALHGYTLDNELFEEVGFEAINQIPGLEEFYFISADSGGYTNYFGIRCNTEEEGKNTFEKAFPKLEGKFQEVVEVL